MSVEEYEDLYSESMRDLAKTTLARMRPVAEEDVEEWAEQLSRDVMYADD